MILTRENWSTRRKTCPSATSSATNPTRTGLWLNTNRRHQFPSRLVANFRNRNKINETKRNGQQYLHHVGNKRRVTDIL